MMVDKNNRRADNDVRVNEWFLGFTATDQNYDLLVGTSYVIGAKSQKDTFEKIKNV